MAGAFDDTNTMNRSFYTYIIFFLVLAAVAALYQGILQLIVGAQLFTLQSFSSWFLLMGLCYLLSALFVLKYYHHKQYRWALFANAIAALAILFQGIVLLAILWSGQLQDLYIPATFLVLGTEILYALSLIFSKAAQRPWLKRTGIVSLVLGVVLLAALTLRLNSADTDVQLALDKMLLWASIAVCFIPLLLIRNFQQEQNVLSETEIPTSSKNISELYLAMAVVASGFVLVLALKLGTQAYRKSHVSAATRLMAHPFEARTYTNHKGDSLLYRLLIPLDYDSTRQYPLMVCLHGGAGWGDDNLRQMEGSLLAQMLSKPINREKYPAFLLVPQCPYGTSWGGIDRYTPNYDSLVFEVISHLEKEFKIDTTRRYVGGHSLGGYGTWYFVGTRPRMFAAAIPISGEGNPALAPNMVDTDIWAFHGAKDFNVPVSGSRDVIEAIREAGGNPQYTEYPDRAHGIWEEVRASEVLDWLFAQRLE